jgi:hypothetical protein
LSDTGHLSSANAVLTLRAVTLKSKTYAQPAAATQEFGATPLRDSLLKQGDKEPFERLDTDDDRIQQVAFAQGELFGVLSTSILSENGTTRSGIAWFTIQPKLNHGQLTARVKHQGYLAVNDGNLLYPSAAINKNSQGVLAFSMTGPNDFPSVAYADISHGQVSNTISVAANGKAPEDGFTGYLYYGGNGIARWGDYSAATVDPSCQLWFSAEAIPGSQRTLLADWGTFIAALPASKCDGEADERVVGAGR